MTKFKAIKGAQFSDEDAQSYGVELLHLTKKRGGSLNPLDVVIDAKNPKTSYHKFFEWDNEVCGDKFRLSQARHLLGNIVEIKTIGTEQKSVRVFFNIVSEKQEKKYFTATEVFSNENYSQQVVAMALDQLRRWTEKYETYSELAGLCDNIKKLCDDMK